jgi:exonuclease SbcC
LGNWFCCIFEIDAQAQEHERLAKKAEAHLRTVDAQLQTITAQERDAAVAHLAHTHHQTHLARKKGLEQQHTQSIADIASLQQTLMKIDGELKTLAPPLTLATIRSEHDSLAAKERELSIKHGTLTQKIETLGKTSSILTQEIERKEEAKKRLERSQQAHHYLTDAFIPLMSHIEKHVLAKIHHEFDAIFSQWFSQLASDLMTARLDETFTPTIQQNGYDTDVAHLSGGERTACALAYRLALNKTINSLINTIRTKDLLILDEPTDGFSSEQLDKMREVLAQLALGQIIIVSHEQKIEGFADHVIRVQKNEHTSEVS